MVTYCAECTTGYAPDLDHCPHCGSSDTAPERETMAGKISKAAGPTVEGELPPGTREDRSVSEGPLPRIAGTDPEAGAQRAAQNAPETPRDPQERADEQSREEETSIGGRRSETSRVAGDTPERRTSDPARPIGSAKAADDEKSGDTAKGATRGK